MRPVTDRATKESDILLSVNRKYLQVVLIEAAIITGLVVLGRFFS
jgi:hypothetical protein